MGLLSPHVSPDDGLLSRWSRAGLRATWSQVERLLKPGLHYCACGVLQRRLDAAGALPSNWPEAGDYWSQPASQIPGMPPESCEGAIWHARGGWIKPSALIGAWLDEAQLSPHIARVERLQRQDGLWLALGPSGQELGRGDLVILANATDCLRLLGTLHLQGLQVLRGQLSWARVQPGDDLPPVPVNGHGHLVPAFPDAQGQMCWQLGASFERDQTELRPSAHNHADSLNKLRQLLPRSAESLARREVQSWVGLRSAYKDHLPLIGPLDEQRWPGLWLSTAYGSRGLAGTALAGELIAAWLHDEPLPLEGRLAQAVRASRALGV